MISSLLSLAIAYFMAALFMQSGLHKLISHRAFRVALRGHNLVPRGLEYPISVTLALGEIALSLSWVLVPQAPVVGLTSAALLIAYGIILLRSYLTDRGQAGCGCEWGRESQPVQPWMPIRNVLIAGLALSTLASGYDANASLAMTFSALAFSIFAMLTYFAVSELASVFYQSRSLKEARHV